MDHTYLQFLLQALGFQGSNKLDANETIAFARAFEEVEATLYEVQYPGLKARSLFPLHTVGNTTRTVTYRIFDKIVPDARLINDYGDDFPEGDILGSEFSTGVVALGAGYSYSVQDIRDSVKLGMPLDQARAEIAREMIERKIDALIASGDANTGTLGVMSSTNVSLYNPVTPGTVDSATTWQHKLYYDQSHADTLPGVSSILSDVTGMLNKIRDTTKNIYGEDPGAYRILLPETLYNLLTTAPRSVLYSDQNLLTYLKNASGVQDWQPWNKLNLAASGGTTGRIFMYPKDNARVIDYVMGQEFEQMTPQVRNMKFSVACHARCGGARVRTHKACAYIDGADSGSVTLA